LDQALDEKILIIERTTRRLQATQRADITNEEQRMEVDQTLVDPSTTLEDFKSLLEGLKEELQQFSVDDVTEVFQTVSICIMTYIHPNFTAVARASSEET